MQVFLERLQRFLQLTTFGFTFFYPWTRGFDLGTHLVQLADVGLGQGFQFAEPFPIIVFLLFEVLVLSAGKHQIQGADFLEEFLMPTGLADLPSERAYFATNFFDDIVKADQIALRAVELALGLLAPALVLGDTRAFLEQLPQILVVLVQDLFDHRLFDNGISGVVDSACEEQIT